MEYDKIEKAVMKAVVIRDTLTESLSDVGLEIEQLQKKEKVLLKIVAVVSEAIKVTQDNFKGKIEGLVTNAVQFVFQNNQKFVLKFSTEKTGAKYLPMIEDDGELLIPKEEMGAGVLPIISFALKVIVKSFETLKTRNFLIFDEPIRGSLGSGGGYLIRAVEFFKEVSKKAGIQIIFLTHVREIAEVADNVIYVKKVGKISEVTNERRISHGSFR